MTVHYDSLPEYMKCAVVVHGNGLFANVKAFDDSSPENQLISLGALQPDNVIRLDIILEQGDWVAVQLGRVQWVSQDTVAVGILQMGADDKRKLDEAAWACVKGEVRLFRWLRKQFRGDEIHNIYILFDPLPNVRAVRLQEAA
jgi:predicted LPLAT superfamily acyltransferase